jgi:hypothetical protein
LIAIFLITFANLKNSLANPLREFAMFLLAVAVFQCRETSFQIFLTSCFNFLTSCSVLSVVIGGLFLLANYNARNRTGS